MNIFRILGDLSHVVGILLLLYTIEINRSSRGISIETEALQVLVFVTRYIDLTFQWVSLYNTCLKIFFIAISVYTVYVMKYRFQKSEYEAESDIDKPFPVLTLIIPCFLFALFFNYLFTVTEVLWAFSIYLEAVAIIPQIVVLLRTEDGQSLIQPYYLIALGLYRAIYGLNWIYRYKTEGLFDPIAILGGLVQTSLYIYFFWVYFVRIYQKQAIELPEPEVVA